MHPILSLKDRESLGTAVQMQPVLNIPGSVSSCCAGEKIRPQQTVMVRKMYMLSSTG